MPYLIDGHNLIHYLDDIRLDNPNDEAELVIKLRGFCAKHKKKLVVVFDKGLPGGHSQLSTPSVKVIFASFTQTTADSIIRERIRKTRDIKGWVVVSSDNEILDEAEGVGMRGMKSSNFAELLQRPLREKPHPSENPNLRFSEAEVDEWMKLFGIEDDIDEGTWEDEPEIPQAKVEEKPKAEIQKKSPELAKTKQEAKSDVDDWLDIFGEEVSREASVKADKLVPRERPQGLALKDPEQVDISMKGDEGKVSENSVKAWLDVFGEPDPQREPTDPAFQRDDPEKQGRYRNALGRHEPTVHKRMATSEDIHLNEGEVDAWMDVFGADDKD